MSGSGAIRRLLIAATAAALVVAGCAIKLRDDNDHAQATSTVTQSRDSVEAELERCRKVALEQVADIQKCRRAWTENRLRFLGQRKGPGAPTVDAQSGPASLPSGQFKDPDRLPQGRGPLAAPKSE